MYLCMYDRPIPCCHISPFLCLVSPREKSGNSFSEVMPFFFSFFPWRPTEGESEATETRLWH